MPYFGLLIQEMEIVNARMPTVNTANLVSASAMSSNLQISVRKMRLFEEVFTKLESFKQPFFSFPPHPGVEEMLQEGLVLDDEELLRQSKVPRHLICSLWNRPATR